LNKGGAGILEKLTVIDYRNIQRARLLFSPNQNILFGENAQGKTNLLEVIYLLATGRSFRTTRIEDIFPWVGGNPKIRGEFKDAGQDLTIEVEISPERKIARINGDEKGRLAGLLGLNQVIEIIPQDVLLVDGEPSRRRRFLDIGICQWDSVYYKHLSKYQQALKQRNSALSQGIDLTRDRLRIWNKILEEHGSYLIWQRKRVVQQLQEQLQKLYPEMAQKDEKGEVSYRSGIEASEIEAAKDEFCIKLLESESKDMAVGFTTVGPHRDDLVLSVQSREAKSFASEGQKRTLVIALKLALGLFLKETEGKNPIFVLDDVLTQLDEIRRKGLMNALSAHQSFISVTSAEFHGDLVREGKWFQVKGGEFNEYRN